jgi:hypothetical protein
MTAQSSSGSIYNGWFCQDLTTECPDCAETLDQPDGDLDKFLTVLSEHIDSCGELRAIGVPL